MPAISIVVPVYKAEKYLHRCVDSILSQTFADFEVLLIDDGSPDGSGLICDAYAEQDPRVRVFHKKNGGVASARELGVQNAKGEYIIHADSDDWVEPDMLEEMFRAARESNADMVICDYFVKKNDEESYAKQEPTALKPATIISDLLAGKLNGFLWNKLIKSECYEGIHFVNEMTYGEDLLACLLILQRGCHVCHISKAFYHYDCDINNSSLTKRYDIKAYKSEKFLLQQVNKDVENEDLQKVWNYRFTLTAYFVFRNNLFDAKEYRREYKQNVRYLLENRASLKMKFFTLMSALGLKSIVYPVYRFLNFSHRLILKKMI